MKKQIKIKSFNDLIEFIEIQNAPAIDVQDIIAMTMGVYVSFTSQDHKIKLIKDLKRYWSKYKNRPLKDRPIFLGD
jgi:hypothetical protein